MKSILIFISTILLLTAIGAIGYMVKKNFEGKQKTFLNVKPSISFNEFKEMVS